MTARKICVVTGSRAEYGLLYWLMREIRDDPALTLQVAVTGMHLAPEFGSTWRVIEADGFTIDARVETQLASDTVVGMAKSTGLGVLGFADAFQRLQPDIVVVLGDRYEILAAAQAALLMDLPVAHLHGGELTEGAVDDAIRHALTKMSHLHFVAAAPYARRVLQMGEEAWRVHDFGAPGLDHVRRTPLLDRAGLANNLGIEFGDLNLLVTYHPATLGEVPAETAFAALAEALAAFPGARCVFTRANADAAGRAINARIDDYVAAHPGSAWVFSSLGQMRYLSLLGEVDAIVGNSSSGLIEAPLLGTATVNIGPRQDGRLRAPSVIDCGERPEAIRAALQRALGPAHRAVCERRESVYGHGCSAERIKDVLAGVDLGRLRRKHFQDLP